MYATLIAVIALHTLGALAAAALVGKPRPPITGLNAALTVAVNGLAVAALCWIATTL